jgi:hypothetical protein
MLIHYLLSTLPTYTFLQSYLPENKLPGANMQTGLVSVRSDIFRSIKVLLSYLTLNTLHIVNNIF